MNCCIDCFNDDEIIGFIRSNSTAVGACDFCGGKTVKLIDARELEEMFQPVVALFKPIAVLGITVAEEKFLHQKIQENWKIFKTADEAFVKGILIAILSDSIPDTDPILNSPVEIEALFNPALAADHHEKKWENFAKEIKYVNRFFLTETVDLILLQELLESFSKSYDKGKLFYRSRISDKAGFDLIHIGKPPADKAASGRANPNGIPYLYISTKIETALHECRPSYPDFVTIGEFKLKAPLSVVSLRDIAAISPFAFGDQIERYVIHQKYLARLEQELSKPVKRNDKELDYLPSQYLCEYVKSLKYDAIEYGSSLNAGGINLAVFDDTNVEPRSVEVYEITKVDLTYQKVVV